MEEAAGLVIGTKSKSPLHKGKHVLEIELDQQNKQLLNWQSKEVVIKQKEMEEKLRKRIEELEKFNKFAVNRELKMVELKKRIERLEEQLKNH
ncbi:hypothetical protein KY361_04295 [Candidatus Woesearchaeota archaeon]|nr:hypothetical protein [Candidatus Woesearchaeota archaeon]